MTWADIIQSFGALLFVLCLMGLAALVLRRLGGEGKGLPVSKGKPARLKLVERLTLSPKHRVVLMEKDGEDYLLLITSEGTQVLERPRRGRRWDADGASAAISVAKPTTKAASAKTIAAKPAAAKKPATRTQTKRGA